MKLANYEISLLAKEKGFESDITHSVYEFGGDKISTMRSFVAPRYRIPAPYLYELTDWLREEKGIHVTPIIHPLSSSLGDYSCEIHAYRNGEFIGDVSCLEIGLSYDQALESGVKKALELIPTKTN